MQLMAGRQGLDKDGPSTGLRFSLLQLKLNSLRTCLSWTPTPSSQVILSRPGWTQSSWDSQPSVCTPQLTSIPNHESCLHTMFAPTFKNQDIKKTKGVCAPTCLFGELEIDGHGIQDSKKKNLDFLSAGKKSVTSHALRHCIASPRAPSSSSKFHLL